MKFSVNSDEFLSSINPAIIISSKNALFETELDGLFTQSKFAGLITLKVTQDNIVLLVNAGKACIVLPLSNNIIDGLNYHCKEEGDVTVKAAFLNEALKTIPSGNINFILDNGSLIISQEGKKANKRSLPTYNENVIIEKISSTFEEEVSVNKSIFKDALAQVKDAPSQEEKMINYRCVLLEAKFDKTNQYLTLMAGNGGRFIIDTMRGNNIFEKNCEVRMLIPSLNISNIYSILEKVPADYIKIKFSDEKNTTRRQVVFVIGHITICLTGLEEIKKKYPNLLEVIKYDYPNAIKTNFQDWAFVDKGIGLSIKVSKDSSIDGDDKSGFIHNSEIVLKEDNRISIITKTNPVNETEIDVLEMAKKENIKNIWVRCNSNYFQEVYKLRARKTGNITLFFESMEPEKDNIKNNVKPVVVKYDDYEDSARNLIETVYMFFATSSK